LNIVCLGMQALQSDLGAVCSSINYWSQEVSFEKNYVMERLRSAEGLITDIFDSGSAAVAVLNDLINYDKIESNTMVLQYTIIDPRLQLEAILRSLQVQAKQASIKLTIQFDDSFENLCSKIKHAIIGDRLKIGQVIRNIVSNALKFSPKNSEVIAKGISKQII
jgi:signal transduction histidine kinase